ncbi:MAG: UvrB/UvrC motif-containing protein [Planctomycetaceae bacterium]|jgi:hypothetical protein|nr:UvrB/UvrC motif-containing protein [Phycisphaerales bacterium]MCE2653457.1 UvrB/UvrC motif-containing protein [Planctomycetaceae bacterium]
MDRPDLTRLLEQWPYEPGKISVRLIEGEDGEPRIQMRLDLGILQMHVDGRPDGSRPRGFDSLLEYHEARLDDARREGPSTEFSLSSDDCRELREEAAQYYRRYTALWILEDFEGVVRDTSRNLRAMDLMREFAENEPDRTELEPFRPYVVMMRARALASQAFKDKEVKAAVQALDDGLAALQEHFQSIGQEAAFESASEVQLLRSMRDALAPRLPVSQSTELRRRLDQAVKNENYELAAILRDELRALEEQSPGKAEPR